MGTRLIWEIRSAETFEVLYCDICNMRSELRDALQMEAHYKAENARLTEALRVKEAECERLGKPVSDEEMDQQRRLSNSQYSDVFNGIMGARRGSR